MIRSPRRAMRTTRCRHNYGWLTVHRVQVYLSPTRQVIHYDSGVPTFGRGSRRNKIILKCNNAECPATRNGYFDDTGRLRTVGRVRNRPAARRESALLEPSPILDD